MVGGISGGGGWGGGHELKHGPVGFNIVFRPLFEGPPIG